MGLKKSFAKTLRGPVANLSMATAFAVTAVGGGYAFNAVSHMNHMDTQNTAAEQNLSRALDQSFSELESLQGFEERERIKSQLSGTDAPTAQELAAASEREVTLRQNIYSTMILNPDISNDSLARYMTRFNDVTGTESFNTGTAAHHDQCRLSNDTESRTAAERYTKAQAINSCMDEEHTSPFGNALMIAFGLFLIPLHRPFGEKAAKTLKNSKTLNRWANGEKKPKNFGN